MNFCERCNIAFGAERCPVCNSKNVRQVHDDDFCFLIEDSMRHCDILTGVLDANDIPYSAMPFGSGVETCFGKSLSNYRIYVPYSSLENAQGILHDMEAQKTEQWRALLLDNISSFNISPKIQKKAYKKLKLPKGTDIIAFCSNIVKSANRIIDDEVVGCEWRYVFCYSDEYSITFNSMSFEILAVRKKA